jgi:hypothetical protein
MICAQICVLHTQVLSLNSTHALYAGNFAMIKIARQHFYTIPLGPQLQVLWRTPEGAYAMGHCACHTAEILQELDENGGIIHIFDDIYHGRAYLEAVSYGDISTNNMVLMFAMDSAQLYQDKVSDCMIYIWVIYDLLPDGRYKKKHIIIGGIGGIIPGPNNPKNLDSFLFPSFHHLAVLQKEGLCVWNTITKEVFTSFPFLHLGAADAPGSMHFTGLVGHHGAYPCCLYCAVKG